MFSRTRFAAIASLMVVLSACGGSGGGGRGLSGGESDGGALTATPAPPAPPTGTPVAAAPLACGGAERSGCPEGYHCVADPTAGCDAAAGVACGGICALGDDLPACDGAGACPDGYACDVDPAGAGVCRPVAHDPCADDAGCAMLDAPCRACADGALRCSEPRCVNGGCRVDDDPCATPPTCGGIAGAGCPPGFECVDDANDMCEPGTGADCSGTCQPSPDKECASDADCPMPLVPCPICADGTLNCPRAACVEGRCAVELPSCEATPECATDADCASGQTCALPPVAICDPAAATPRACGGVCVPNGPTRCGGPDGATCPDGFACVGADGEGCQPDANGNACAGICLPAPPPFACRTADDCVAPDRCTPCPDGSIACPKAQCLDGLCILAEPPRCGGPGQCDSDADCAVIAVCRTCPDGAYSCPQAQCRNGTCDALYPGCPEPATCGGIAGIPCPMGYTCVDRPDDGCDPDQGGADCGGVCRREDGPRPCELGGADCPDGYACVAAPNGCPPDAAGCPGICRPKPSPMCAGDADCPALGVPCQLCADNTSACPRSYCADGQCRVDFPGCQAAGL